MRLFSTILVLAVWPVFVLGQASKIGSSSVDADRLQYVSVAKLVTFPWVRNGTIHAGGDDPVDIAVSLFTLDLTLPALLSAREDYLAVGLAQMAGFKLGERGNYLTVGDIRNLAETLRAALLKKYKVIVGKIVGALVGGVVDDLQRRVGDEIFAKGIALHTALWKDNMISVARRFSGPRATKLPLRLLVARGTEPKTGLALLNTSGAELRNVTVQIYSRMGTRDFSGVSEHFIFVERWSAGGEVLLAPMVVLSALQLLPDSAFIPTITYSLWSDQATAENVEVELPRDRYRKIRQKGSAEFRLALTVTGEWAKTISK